MKYTRFEELPVWQAAQELSHGVFDVTENLVFKGHYSLRDQLERATLSISNNIAEGFERGTTQELLNFIYIARGSAAEVRSMLCFIEARPTFTHFKSQISNFKLKAENISRQLRGWAESLQNSKIKGQKFLTEKEAKHYRLRPQSEEQDRELKQFLSQATRQADAQEREVK